MKTYDLIILGGGPGGYVAALRAAQSNLKVALIEKEAIGGVCLNHGCIPTKTLLKNIKVLESIKKASDFGIRIEGVFYPELDKMIKRKNTVVKRLTTGISGLIKQHGIDFYQGIGVVQSSTQVEVNQEILKTRYLIIATGASPIIPPISGIQEGLDQKWIMTSKELLNLMEIPKKMIVLGGGVIGVEFASIFAALGTEVTILEKQSTLLPLLDHEVVDVFSKHLKKMGITILTDATISAIENRAVIYAVDDTDHRLETDIMLLSVGMRPNSNGFDHLGLRFINRAIETDQHLCTNVKNVYAIGDVNGKYMLAHVASHEGLVAVDHLLGKSTKMQYDYIPNVVYGSLEIASIGMTEKEVQQKGLVHHVVKYPVMALGKALADHEKEGFIKLITHPESHHIYGVHIVSYQASELIAEIGSVIELGGTAYHLAHAIHPHPTLSELIFEGANLAIGTPIHL